VVSDSILPRIVDWAESREDVRAAVLTGSRARDDGSVDHDADYDIELFTSRIERYETDTTWIPEIAPVWVYLRLSLPTDDRYRMWLVVFDGGQKVDLGFAPTIVLDEMVTGYRLNELYERGYRVLFDKDGGAASLPPASGAAPVRQPPTASEVRAAINEFWFEAFHIPKLLQRNDLWVVKMRDWTMKQRLLQMIEWHALATHGSGHDVWHIGTRMDRWASPQVWVRLKDVFGRFDRADSWSALFATVALFRDLSRETTASLGYEYPEAVDAALSAYIERRYALVRSSPRD
jgi:aminoglycoside 6-adenylyltransferase